MNYEEFLVYIEKNLKKSYREVLIDECGKDAAVQELKEINDKVESAEVRISKVYKNNGIVLDAVSIFQEGDTSPNIYLEPFYSSYIMGKLLDFVMAEIIHRYLREKENVNFEEISLSDYNIVKNKIVVRLVNFERNQEMLKGCPHKKYLDLAITFRYVVEDSTMGMASILIKNTEYEKWGVDLSELYELALSNTMRLFPEQVDSIYEIMYQYIEEQMKVCRDDAIEEFIMSAIIQA